MTRIDFYTHVPDKARFTCAILAKVVERGNRAFVLVPDRAQAERLDELLWTFQPLSFLPHCLSDHKLSAETAVVIDHRDLQPPHDDILLNLRPDRPAIFSRFQRLVEIVSTDDDDRAAARDRFKFYRDRGYEIQSHNMGER